MLSETAQHKLKIKQRCIVYVFTVLILRCLCYYYWPRSDRVGLRIPAGKNKLRRISTENDGPVMLGGNRLDKIETFTYLVSIVNNHGGNAADVKAWIGKARVAFLQLKKNTWSARAIGTKSKFRIFNSNVKSIILYGSETWRTTKKTTRKVQTFMNNCLRRIQIQWPETLRMQNFDSEQSMVFDQFKSSYSPKLSFLSIS